MDAPEIVLLRQKIVEISALLTQAAQNGRGINEADTEHIIIDPLLSALGYSPLEIKKRRHDGVTRTFPDYTLLDGSSHRWFLEAKELDLPLQDREATQAVGYAINQGAAWAILTNGRAWYFYLAHLQKPLNEKRVFQIDDIFADFDKSVALLRFLARASMMQDGLTQKYNAEQTQAQINALVRRELTTPGSVTRKALRKAAGIENGTPVSEAMIGDVLQSLLTGSVVTTPAVPAAPPQNTAPPVLVAPLVPTSPPAGVWRTLAELRRDLSLTTGRKPAHVRLGDADVKEIKSWSELAQCIVQFIGETCGLPSLPFALKGTGKKYFLNTQPLRADGQPMITKAQTTVSGQVVFIDTNRSASNTVSALVELLTATAAPLDAVVVEIKE